MPQPGGYIFQPLVSRPRRSAARRQLRAQPVSSGGASTSSGSPVWPDASTHRWNGLRAPHSGCECAICPCAPVHQSYSLSAWPNSSAVRDVKQIVRSGRTPASTMARAIPSITATPLALSKAARNQPSWWAPTTIGAPRRRPGRYPTAFDPCDGPASTRSVSFASPWPPSISLRTRAASSLRIVTIGGAPAYHRELNAPSARGLW